MRLLSCRFLNEITDNIASKKFYSSYDEAFNDAKKGKIVGLIHFAMNFSRATNVINEKSNAIDSATFENGAIKIHLDQSDTQVTLFMKTNLYAAYKRYTQSIATACGYSMKLFNIPLEFAEPIYGSFDPNLKVSKLTPFTMLMFFNSGALLAIGTLIPERKEGLWNRTLIAGVSMIELMTSHAIICIAVIFIHLLEIAAGMMIILKMEFVGSFMLVTLLWTLVALSGLSFGLFLSCIIDDFVLANYLNIGVFLGFMFTSGIFWPIEGMPMLLRYASYMAPTTLPNQSITDVVVKGFTIAHPSVLIGLSILVIWFIAFILIGLITLEKRRFCRNT
jgi:ABC-type multidrug transport system permease subunit